MKREDATIRIYDLIEQFDFDELPEKERLKVLQSISEKEYRAMRDTLLETAALFQKEVTMPAEDHTRPWRKFLIYPIEFYKVAAVFLLAAGIGMGIIAFHSSGNNELLARTDTLFVDKTDTVYIIKKEKVYLTTGIGLQKAVQVSGTPAIYYKVESESDPNQPDCKKVLCPDDLNTLCRKKAKGDFASDTVLSDFVASRSYEL
jgi:hypothetical protein